VNELQTKLELVRERIADAAKNAGRRSEEIRLVVVTKGQPAGLIQELYQLGVREIGESYVDEGLEKKQSLGALNELRWHMIGHIQSRKAKEVAQNFAMIHSVDSFKLAERLNRFTSVNGHNLSILLECNVSGEGSKFGWHAWEEDRWEDLVPEIKHLLQLSNLRICGLMSMAPFQKESEGARPYFERTRRLRDFLTARFPEIDWRELSMGMSGDFEVAIGEGATIVRIGTAIVGERKKKAGV
jgi:pyridoxal phosphate enzyme (YggS family)